ncbi:AAA family ATPase [Marinobacter nauticus]|uniref:AAA ATPase n=1 Tax=Marinobacter nauticus (strain ATCC 700491 / DSM 11845 / VT8) TaxID=351348 RepID=A1U312_MARN8|nr:AAA family ATPase [Marinobacter nauticus]ABM19381.1 AAA ATPase [Marinobacter nauticus VT8]
MTSARLYTLVQVVKQRKGGCCFVHVLNTDGTIKKRKRSLIVRFSNQLGEVPVGSLWKVSGHQIVNQFVVKGAVIYEDVLDATRASMLQPAKHTLSRWISLNIDGIGEIIANRLVRQRNLKKWVRTNDTESLSLVPGMNPDLARRLIERWPDEGLHRTMDWLDALNLSPSLGFKLVRLFGKEAVERLTDNPFLLLGLNVAYDQVLAVIEQLELELSHDTFVAGAAMHVVIKRMSANGSTVISDLLLRQSVEKLTGLVTTGDPGQAAVQQGLLVRVQDGYQVWGTALMEAAVASKLVKSLNRPSGQGSLLASWEHQLSESALQAALKSYEQQLPFTLSEEQQQAVIGAVSAPVVGISGGAGTGKTTILQAIISVYQALADGIACLPVALSGRAAQRMAQSTGMPAQTIAKLIADHLGEGKPLLQDHLLIIIDEASMVDLLSMYRLVRILPEATRFIFLGDCAQLSPVGGGLVFHAMYDSPIPFFELSQVRRQSVQSPVHRFAMAVRKGEVLIPEMALKTLPESPDCCVLPPSLDRLTHFWEAAGALSDRIILSPRRSGDWGVTSLNTHFQKILGSERDDLHYLDPVKGWIPWITRFKQRLKLGDPVLVTRNIYDDELDVRNGDLGIITEVFQSVSAEGWSGVVYINGERKGINQELLEVLDLGYAISIHKAQGSQWHTVFSVVTSEARRMLDASMVYTAATRPTDRLILVTDAHSLRGAVSAGNSASRRHVDLGRKLAMCAQTQFRDHV